jgi:crotonobetainyl-CoA:carnitine CoA-transferase CaiB-like acyl-CoA transferase
MEATDVCFAPVLTMSEAGRASAQRRARHVRGDCRCDAACSGAPVFPICDGSHHATRPCGQHSVEILRDWGFDDGRIEALMESGAVVAA